ncbi:MAG: hypothetical protein MJE68_32735, partial [Proteobacteria bacterium]|nr:hypothetical protein [Pseudomonadota bacterium]
MKLSPCFSPPSSRGARPSLAKTYPERRTLEIKSFSQLPFHVPPVLLHGDLACETCKENDMRRRNTALRGVKHFGPPPPQNRGRRVRLNDFRYCPVQLPGGHAPEVRLENLVD